MIRPDAKALLDRAGKLREARQPFESWWNEVKTYIAPDAVAFSGDDTPGASGRAEILDSTAEEAAETFAGGLNGFLTNPGTKWFSLKPADEDVVADDEVARWLEDCRDRMLTVFESPRSHFTTAAGQAYDGLVNFGSTCLYARERPGQVPLFETRPLAELCFAENGDGEVDTVFRHFTLPSRAALQRGWATPKIREKAAKNPDEPLRFLQVVGPRADHVPDPDGRRQPTRQKRFADIIVAVDEVQVVEEGGYDEQPLVAARFSVKPGEVYGRGPGMRALRDVKLLQRMARVTIRAGESAIRPALLVPDDGLSGALDLRAGAVNYINLESLGGNSDFPRRLVDGANPGIGEELMDVVRARVKRRFYNHLVMPVPDDPRMTATQTLKLDSQSIRVLGDPLGRLQSEMIGPIVDRTFMIMLRAGQFLPVPEAMRGREIKADYVSPWTRAMRQGEAAAVGQWLALQEPAIARGVPQLDLVDWDRVGRDTADIIGLQKDWLRPARAILEARQQRAAAQQEAAAVEAAPQLAGAAQAAAQAKATLQPPRAANAA